MFKKYVVLSTAFLLAIVPIMYLELAPLKNGLTEVDVIASLSMIIGLLTFSVLLIAHIISHFTKNHLELNRTVWIFFLTIIIELSLQFVIAHFTKVLLNLLGITLLDGIDDKIFFQYVSYVNASAAGVAYFIVGYLIYFRSASIKPALIFGLTRFIIQVGYVLFSTIFW